MPQQLLYCQWFHNMSPTWQPAYHRQPQLPDDVGDRAWQQSQFILTLDYLNRTSTRPQQHPLVSTHLCQGCCGAANELTLTILSCYASKCRWLKLMTTNASHFQFLFLRGSVQFLSLLVG